MTANPAQTTCPSKKEKFGGAKDKRRPSHCRKEEKECSILDTGSQRAERKRISNIEYPFDKLRINSSGVTTVYGFDGWRESMIISARSAEAGSEAVSL